MKVFKAIILVVLPVVTIFLYFVNPDRPGRLVFTLFMLFFIFERTWEGLYTSREKEKNKIEGDWTLSVSIVSYIILGAFCLCEFYLIKRDLNLIVTLSAAAIYLAALFLRLWAVNTLGNQWSVHIIGSDKLNTDRQLIKKGPYRFMRHPVYLGIILEQTSVPLAANLYWTFAVVLLITIPLQCLKAKLEELEMQKYLKEKYTQYMRETPRFNMFYKLFRKK